jgi:hypothetical protein
LYGCETWSVTSSEEHRLRVLQKQVVRKVFGPKSEQVTGNSTKLHKYDLHEVFLSYSIKKVKQCHYRPGQALGAQEVQAPRFPDNRHMKVVR